MKLGGDFVEQRLETIDRGIELPEIARILGEQEAALRALGVEHHSRQVAGHERLAFFGRGDGLAGLVDALVARLRDDEERRNECRPEQDRGDRLRGCGWS